MTGVTKEALGALPASLPAPQDDGAAKHLPGMRMPDIALAATDGSSVTLAALAGRTVVYAYPRTGVPGQPPFTEDWDLIPGARGCTPQSCDFRDHHGELQAAGARVFGLSTQTTEFQQEARGRLHLPFDLLSDDEFRLTEALRLPAFEVNGTRLLKRLTLVIGDGVIEHVFYPVFPPDRHAGEVLRWLQGVRG
jgi:peroxiredoxin